MPRFPVAYSRIDDKPALAVDTSPTSPYRDRVYLVFQEAQRPLDELVFTYSTDGGTTWASPQSFADGFIPGLAVAPDGTLYIAWSDGHHLWLSRSTDGGRTLTTARSVVAIHHESLFPAAEYHLVSSNPTLAVLQSRVYLAYDDIHRGNRISSYVKVLQSDLTDDPRLVLSRVIARPRRPADRFLPIIAADDATGRLWDCFYATDGADGRRAVRFSCSTSRDGGRSWSHPTPAASAFSSDPLPEWFGFGDYEGLAVSDGAAHPIWTDGRGGSGPLGTEIYTATLR